MRECLFSPADTIGYSTDELDTLNAAASVLIVDQPEHVAREEWRKSVSDALLTVWTEGVSADTLVERARARGV
jgi:hypothetical protein